MQVSFVIGGTQKGGTTALDAWLRQHPQLRMARRKEPHFFDRPGGAPARLYPAYHDLFDWSGLPVAVGEATPITMYWLDAPQRVHAYNPAMRWILCLRDPVERAFSHWNMERSRGAEPLAFIDALRAEANRLRAALPLQHRVYSYVDRGFYSVQLQRIFELFPRDQVLVLRSEKLAADPRGCVAEVCRFLGVEPMPLIDYRPVHVGEYATSMTPQERAFLRGAYAAEIPALERLLGWDLSGWMRN